MKLCCCSSVLPLILLPITSILADWRGARDRFWKHHRDTQTLILDDVDYYETMVECLHEHLTEQERADIVKARADRNVGLKLRDDYRGGKVILVGVERAIHPLHVKAVQSLATCIRQIFPHLYEARSFYVEMGLDEDYGLGGNNPTHTAPLVPLFFPEVADEIQRTVELAYDAAGWSYFSQANATKHKLHVDEVLPSPKEVGFRASEHLTYRDFKEGLADHTDGPETYFTVNFAFSGPQDYDGGFFYLKYGEGDLWGEGTTPKEQMLIKPNKYDCLVFLGGPYLHGVTDMTGGNREMFSSELWAFPDAPFGSTLWMNSAQRMEEYVRQCNMEQLRDPDYDGPCRVDMTELLPNNGNNNNENDDKNESGDDDDDDVEQEDQVDEEEDQENANVGHKDIPKEWKDKSTGEELHRASFHATNAEPFFLVRSDLQEGDSSFLYWRTDLSTVDGQQAMIVQTPPRLTEAFQQYMSSTGLDETVQDLLYDVPESEVDKSVYTLKDGTQWGATVRARHGQALDGRDAETDLVQLEPVPSQQSSGEIHSSLKDILKRGEFEKVLEQVARRFSYDAVKVQAVQIMALSHSSDAGPDAHETVDEGFARLFLLMPGTTTQPPAFGIGQREGAGIVWGELNMKPHQAVVVGRHTAYAPGDCDLSDDHEMQLYLSVLLEHVSGSNSQNSTSAASASSSTSLFWSSQETAGAPSCQDSSSQESASSSSAAEHATTATSS